MHACSRQLLVNPLSHARIRRLLVNPLSYDQDHCVYVSETTTFTSADKTMIVQDVMSDPTLPRTKDVQCPRCSGNEAVFISASTEQGMTLYFSCADPNCGHRWRDYV